MNWLKVQVYGDLRLARAGHSAIEYRNSIIILGGLNAQGFLKQGILRLNFD